MTITPYRIASLRRRRRSGSTMIEAVTALAILASFVAGASKLSLNAKQLSDQARSHYQAINVAKNRLERSSVMDFNHLAYFAEDRVRIDESGGASDTGHFRRSTVIRDVASDVKEVVVTVEILDRITLQFAGAKEEVRSWVTPFHTSVQ